MKPTDDDRELLLHRDLPFSAEQVWAVLTDTRHLIHWWGPDGFTIEDPSMDLRVGGEWRFLMIGPDGTRYPNHSIFTAIEAPSLLAYDHGDGQRIWFKAEIRLIPHGEGTRVAIWQRYPTRAERDQVVERYGAIEGGKQTLAKLEGYLQSLR